MGDGLGIKAGDGAHLQPLPNQSVTDEDQRRLARLGNNPPRKLPRQGETRGGPSNFSTMRRPEVTPGCDSRPIAC